MLAGCLWRPPGPKLEGAWRVQALLGSARELLSCIPAPSREPGTAWVPYICAEQGNEWMSEFSRASGQRCAAFSRGAWFPELLLILVKAFGMPCPRVGSKYWDQGVRPGDQPGHGPARGWGLTSGRL